MDEVWGNKDQRRESFIRWQQITVQQFSYVSNLLLAFSGASIGFEISTYLNERFSLSAWNRPVYLISLLLLSLAVLLGLAVSMTRLFDFRYTTRLARTRWRAPDQESKIECLEERTESLGRASWILFYGQVISFGLGVTAVAYVYFSYMLQ